MFFDSHDDDDYITTSYASPYRSLLSAASLAASVKVNSVVKPDLNPALSAQLNISMLQVKFTNHLHAIGRGKIKIILSFLLIWSYVTFLEYRRTLLVQLFFFFCMHWNCYHFSRLLKRKRTVKAVVW